MARRRRRRRKNKVAETDRPVAPPTSDMMPRNRGIMSAMMENEEAETAPDNEEAEGESNVSPEEQRIYDKFMENYLSIMYSEKGRQKGPNGEPSVFDSIKGFFLNIENKIDALANAATTVVDFLMETAEQAGKPIPGDIVLHAGKEIITDLAEFGEAVGVEDYTEEEISLAFYKAADLMSDILEKKGKLNKSELDNDLADMKAAERSGKIDEMLPGISDAAKVYGNQQQEESLPQGGGMMAPMMGRRNA